MSYEDWKKAFVEGDTTGLQEINSDEIELQRLEAEKNNWLKEQGYDYVEDMEQEFWNTARVFGDMDEDVKYISSLNNMIFDLKQKLGLKNVIKRNTMKSAKDAATFDELKKYFSDTYSIIVQDSIKKLDMLKVRESLSGVEKVFSEYPELSNIIQTIETSNDGVMSCNGTKITFNPLNYGKKCASLQELCENMSDIHHWIKNATPESIGVHEAGHGVEWLLIQLDPGYVYDFERVAAWNKGSEAKSIVNEAINEIKKTVHGKGKNKEDLVSAISDYANTEDSETIAEAFADVFANGSNANPLSVEIKRIAMERYKKYKGGA